MKFNYKGHILEIEKTERGYYCGSSQDIDWWTWCKKGYKEIVDSFIKAVDNKLAGIVEKPAGYGLSYKGYFLTAKKKDEDSDWYIGTFEIGGKPWTQEGYKLKNLIRCFKYCVDLYIRDNEKEQFEFF